MPISPLPRSESGPLTWEQAISSPSRSWGPRCWRGFGAALRTRHLLTVLEQRAHLDGLTGLANRGVFDDRLPREWEACRRRGAPLAVMIADLDHFKAINDRHGHAAGDEVLRQSAATSGPGRSAPATWSPVMEARSSWWLPRIANSPRR